MSKGINLSSLNDHLLMVLLERLPLNIIWRLPGWNKRLNRTLMLEILWIARNKRKFSVLPKRIKNNRLYNLIRSEHCYGDLYVEEDSDIPVMRHVKGVWALEEKYVIYDGNSVYAAKEGLKDIEELFTDIVYCNGSLIRDKYGTNRILLFQNDEEYLELPYEERLIDYREYNGTVARLIDDGRLIVTLHDSEVFHVTDVISFVYVIALVGGDHLLVLFASGVLEVINVASKTRKNVGGGGYIELGKNRVLYDGEGRASIILNGERGQPRFKVSEIENVYRYPMRNIVFNAGSIGIDGRAFSASNKNILNPELVYKRVISIDWSQTWCIAAYKRKVDVW